MIPRRGLQPPQHSHMDHLLTSSTLGTCVEGHAHFTPGQATARNGMETPSGQALCRRLHALNSPHRSGRVHLPHSDCAGQIATLTHVFITRPLAAGVWDWFAATWAAITGEAAQPRSADLLLADDTRAWGPRRQRRSLWHRLRLAIICQLWTAYQRPRHQPAVSAGVVAARILSTCRKALLADWRLATANIRLSAGVLSDWLRGRNPTLTGQEFTARWCHRGVPCTVDDLLDAQPLIHWSAQHPVPLPA